MTHNAKVKNAPIIIGEITDRGCSKPHDDAGGIAFASLQIRLSSYRDTPEGQRDWAAMSLAERTTLIWAATHGIQADGTLYEITNKDSALLGDLNALTT